MSCLVRALRRAKYISCFVFYTSESTKNENAHPVHGLLVELSCVKLRCKSIRVFRKSVSCIWRCHGGVFLGVTPCSLVSCFQSYEGLCFLHFRSFFALKMEAADYSETLISVRIIGGHIPEHSHLHSVRRYSDSSPPPLLVRFTVSNMALEQNCP